MFLVVFSVFNSLVTGVTRLEVEKLVLGLGVDDAVEMALLAES